MSSGFKTTIGIVLFFSILATLCSTHGMIFPQGISMIDTEINKAGNDVFFVKTKMDFGSAEHLLCFPNHLSEWEGVYDYNWAMIQEKLGADMMLVRAYVHPDLYQPLFFLIAQSKDTSSFHPPPICYRALGYEIDEEDTLYFPVKGDDWSEAHWRSNQEGDIFKGEFSAKKLIVSKRSPDGDIAERRAMLYCYVKNGEPVPHNITMIEVSAIAPAGLSDEGTIELLARFLGDSLPVMFEPRQSDGDLLATRLIQSYGVLGWVIIISAMSLPIAIMFLPCKNPDKSIEEDISNS